MYISLLVCMHMEVKVLVLHIIFCRMFTGWLFAGWPSAREMNPLWYTNLANEHDDIQLMGLVWRLSISMRPPVTKGSIGKFEKKERLFVQVYWPVSYVVYPAGMMTCCLGCVPCRRNDLLPRLCTMQVNWPVAFVVYPAGILTCYLGCVPCRYTDLLPRLCNLQVYWPVA